MKRNKIDRKQHNKNLMRRELRRYDVLIENLDALKSEVEKVESRIDRLRIEKPSRPRLADSVDELRDTLYRRAEKLLNKLTS